MAITRNTSEDYLSYKDLADRWHVSVRTAKRRVALLKVIPARPIHNRTEFSLTQAEQIDRKFLSLARHCRKNKRPIYAKNSKTTSIARSC